MASDDDVFRALTLLLAVCEQALLELERADPPFPALPARVVELRDATHATLTSDRFRTRAETDS